VKRPWPEPFEDCYRVSKKTGCWLWERAVKGEGYGHKWYDGKLQSAHRISWQIHRGPIPDGLWVLHRCDVMLCVNPDHLFLGTHQDNVDDKHRKGRDLKEFCKYGHPLAAGNLYTFSNGRRCCRTCHIRREREYSAQRARV
jgi:hypothetical protein